MARAENKIKGNIGEAAILFEFIKRQIPVSIPYGDNERYDLIAEFKGKLNKIQIKYCSEETPYNGVICPCASSYNHTASREGWEDYTQDGIDYFCFWIAPDNLALIVPMEEIGTKKSITFKRKPSTSRQKTRLMQDFTFDKFFG